MRTIRSSRPPTRSGNKSRYGRESIDYPANPFVALSDFLMVVLLVVILGFVYQSVSSNRLFERASVEHLQQHLLRDMTGGTRGMKDQTAEPSENKNEQAALLSTPSPAPGDAMARLQQAFNDNHFGQPYVDGDLQRFWLDGGILYGSATVASSSAVSGTLSPPLLTEEGRKLLIDFGQVIRPYQGDLNRPGSGLFKRITVQGNADRSEGDDNAVWALSMARAREAAQLLQNEAHISPLLIEASARGCWDPHRLAVDTRPMRLIPGVDDREMRARENRRLEIIVVYSAPRAAQYEHLLPHPTL